MLTEILFLKCLILIRALQFFYIVCYLVFWKNFNKWIHNTCSYDKNFSLYNQDSQISLMRTEFYWIHCSTTKMLKRSKHIYNLYLKQFWLRTKITTVKQSLGDKILRHCSLDFLSISNNNKYNFILPNYQIPTVHKTQQLV